MKFTISRESHEDKEFIICTLECKNNDGYIPMYDAYA